MRKYLLLVLGISFNLQGLDLEEALTSAFLNNLKLKTAKANKMITGDQYTQSKMVFLPTLDGQLSSSRSGDDRSGYQRNGNSLEYGRDVQKSTTTKMTLQMKQNIFNSFKDINNMEAKKNLDKAAYHQLKKETEDLIVEVVKAYTAVWAERQKQEAYMKKERNLHKLYEAQQICLKEGMSTPVEVAEAESKYQNAVYERVNAQTKVIEAEVKFKQITGLEVDQNMVVPKLNIKMPESLEKLKNLALAANQEILKEQYKEKAAYNELYVARGELGPSCDVTVGVNRYLSKPEPRFYQDRYTKNSYNAEISVNVPILHADKNVAVSVANQKAQQATFSSKDKILEIAKQCEVTWNTYKSAEASIAASSTAVKSAEISSESNLEQANLGMKSNTEFLDGESSLLSARIHLAESIKNRIDVLIQMLALTGQLNLQLLVDALHNNKGMKTTVGKTVKA